MKNSKENINKQFYNSLYTKRGFLIDLIYPKISFDQQSKSKINFSILKRHIGPIKNKTILDYGFGHGSLLLKFSKTCTLFGCDISEEAVAKFPPIAIRTGRKIITFLPDDLNTVIPDRSLDCICLSHVIEHIDDDHSLLLFLKRKLKPSGGILINVPINEVWRDPKHMRDYEEKAFLKMLEELNFSIISSSQHDRWTAFFLTYEILKKNKITAPFFRMLRLIFALLPNKSIELSEYFLPQKYQHQQLIVLVSSNE